MNVELKMALLRRFGNGAQIRAARELGIEETRLSRIVNGWRSPTTAERARLQTALGADYFAPEGSMQNAQVKCGG